MRTIRLFTNPRQALICLVVTGALVFFLQMSFLPAISYLGIGIVLFPLLMLLNVSLGGIVPAFFSLVLMLIASKVIYGNEGLWLAVYLLPMSLVFAWCLETEQPFFKTCGLITGTLIASMLLLFIIFQRLTGGNLYGALSKAAIDGLEGFPQRDSLLYTLWRGGLLSHGQDASVQIFDSNLNGGWTFKPEVVEEFYKQISSRVTALAANLLPGLLTNFSITMGWQAPGWP